MQQVRLPGYRVPSRQQHSAVVVVVKEDEDKLSRVGTEGEQDRAIVL